MLFESTQPDFLLTRNNADQAFLASAKDPEPQLSQLRKNQILSKQTDCDDFEEVSHFDTSPTSKLRRNVPKSATSAHSQKQKVSLSFYAKI
jgi:hypothetical protein